MVLAIRLRIALALLAGLLFASAGGWLIPAFSAYLSLFLFCSARSTDRRPATPA
jgi:hypothetical protein